jgi:uncharacterized Ntn-hydrolase superfamily protein
MFRIFAVGTCLVFLLVGNFSCECQKAQNSSAMQLKESVPPAVSPDRIGIPTVATFSIVAYDPNTKELGIAVQSKVVSVGSIVPWAKAGVGAIATQSYANTAYGPQGLKYLEQGLDPNDVIKKLMAGDAEAPSRQIGIVDANGRAANFTGDKCNSWAGGHRGKFYTVQGNILAGPAVVDEMAKAFENTKGELSLRLIAALEAGQAAGGDKRGRQSAALYVVREGWGYGGYNDRYRDIRVDDNPEPIKELRRIYEIYKEVFPQPEQKPTDEKK